MQDLDESLVTGFPPWHMFVGHVETRRDGSPGQSWSARLDDLDHVGVVSISNVVGTSS